MSGRSEARGVPRSERLSERQAFQAVFKHGKRVERPSLVMIWRGWDGPRQVGFAVSRQVRGAVRRNRAKRRLREAYRASRQGLPVGLQLVCVAREAAAEGPYQVLQRDMQEVLAVVARRHLAASNP